MTAEARLIAAELAAATAPCVTCSFQAEGVVLVHLLREQRADIPVLFLDTVHHFPETLAYRDELAERWQLNLIVLRADAPLPGLWRNDPDACCARHKVEPLFAALDAYDVWFTGLRREQSATRAALAQVAPFTLPRGKSGRTRRRTTFRCCRCTSLDTRASAASRARRCRSIPRTRDPAGGADRNSNAAFICSHCSPRTTRATDDTE